MKNPFHNKKKATGDLRALSSLVGGLARPILGKRGFVEVDIITNWELIAGAQIAAYAVPMGINFPKGKRAGGRLAIRVSTGAFALELQHKEKLLLEKVNTYFGYNAVSSLKIVQGEIPKPSRNPRESSDNDSQKNEACLSENDKKYLGSLISEENDDLGKSLANLGKSIITKKDKKN